MDHQLARQFAEAERLSAAMQRSLWKTQNPWVRRQLAGRDDIIDELQRLVVVDDELIGHWARRPRADATLLDAAVANAVSEQSVVALVSQPKLTAEQIDRLAAKCTPVIGWFLLEHQPVEPVTAAGIVAAYVSRLDLQDGPGKVFADRLRGRPDLLAAAAGAVTWGQIGVLLIVVDEVSEHPELLDLVVDALVRLDATVAQSNGDDRRFRGVSRCVERLLRCPALTAAQCETLAGLHLLAAQRGELLARAAADIAAALDDLTCTVHAREIGASGRHANIIATVASHREVAMPYQVAVEAVIHRTELPSGVFTTILESCRGPRSRHVVAEFAGVGRLDDVVAIAETIGTLVLDDVDDAIRTQVLSEMAGDPTVVLTDREIPEQQRGTVVDAYRPISALMHQPKMLAVVLERIEALEPDAAEVALGLLPEWSDDLGSLIDAARSLR